MASRAMGQDIFLARTEEQRQFRRSLMALIPTRRQRHLPTFGKLLPQRNSIPEPEPSVLLFYGPGGMGKTSLTQRLHAIAQSESPFKGQISTLFLDWEQEQKLTVELQVGHDHISPDTVLRVLHKALANAFGGSSFGDYDKALKELTQAEEKVAKAMQGQPDNSLPDQVSKLGAQGVAFALRLHPVTRAAVSQEVLETTLDATFKVSAEGLHQTRQFVQKALTPQEYALYEQPHERLAEALGQGIARLSQRRPLVLLFDTYEIVDRPACDYTLRRVMQTSGNQTLWVLGGRSNLADSGQRGKVYFRGYKRDFTENRIYAKPLSEFGPDLIQQYFAEVAPARPITEDQADAVARFSLGIPFVIRQAAVMWREGKPIEEIVAPTPTQALGSGVSAYDHVITTTSERFLVHCFGAPEQEADLEAIYALALMRRPDADLLRQMLDETNLEARLQGLKERYGFIWVEQLRLDEKLTQFLRAYLLTDLRRTSQRVQTLNDRAIAWLELKIEERGHGIADTAEKLEEEDLAETLLDLAHHQFWHSEYVGMRYLVPRFVEGWQYDQDWTRSLLEIAETFWLCLGPDSQKRVSRFEKVLSFNPDLDSLDKVLKDLEKLAQRGWMDGKGKGEIEAILLLNRGIWFYRSQKYSEALDSYLRIEDPLIDMAIQFKEGWAYALRDVGLKFALKGSVAVPSNDAEQALRKAVQLNPQDGSNFVALGVALYGLGKQEEAAQNLKQGIQLEGKENYSLNWLGNVCRAQGCYEEAIAAYQQAITLAPKSAYPHNGLGNVYSDQGNYDEAITAYQQAITLAPKYATPHNGLGSAYSNQGCYDEAIAAFYQAIALDSKYAAPHNNLGSVYSDQDRYDEAIAAFHQAIALDSKFATPHNNLGSVYSHQGHYDEAIAAYQQTIALDPKYATPHSNLGDVYWAQGRYNEAIAAFHQAIALDPNGYNFNSLGWLYVVTKDYENAKEALKRAIEEDVDWANLFNYGLLWALQGNWESAQENWQKGYQICQENGSPEVVKVFYCIALGNADKEITDLKALLDQDLIPLLSRRQLLLVAQVMQRCPEFAKTAKQAADMLENSLP